MVSQVLALPNPCAHRRLCLSIPLSEIILTLPSDGESSPTIESCVVVPSHHHVACDGEEMNAAEEALLNNEEFKKLIAGLGLPADATVIADGWVYGMTPACRGEFN